METPPYLRPRGFKPPFILIPHDPISVFMRRRGQRNEVVRDLACTEVQRHSNQCVLLAWHPFWISSAPEYHDRPGGGDHEAEDHYS